MTRGGETQDGGAGQGAHGRARAVITGVGALTAAGAGIERFWEAVRVGRNGAAPLIEVRGPVHHPVVGAAVDDACLQESGPWDRAFHMAELAISEALDRAGLAPPALPTTCALIVGTTLGGAIRAQAWHADFLEGRQPRRADLLQSPLHAMADRLATKVGLKGIRTVITNGCVSGTMVLTLAADLVRSGEAEIVLAGASDSLHTFNFTGFASMGILTRDRCVPFGNTGGMLLGEGAAFLVVESEKSARRRGAQILAELAGHGSACDAFHATTPRPDGDGAARAMTVALTDANVSSDQVDLVAAQGVGNAQADAMELEAIRRVFASREAELPVTSLRATTGHVPGASGALDAVVCILAIERGLLPPIGAGTNGASRLLGEPLRIVRFPVERTVEVVLKTSSGFGGMNTALVLRRWNETA